MIRERVEGMLGIEYRGKVDVFVVDDEWEEDRGEIGLEFSRMLSGIEYVKVGKGEGMGK